jgi:endonuclease III
MDQDKISSILINRGNEFIKQPYQEIKFTRNSEADNLLNNLSQLPHAFVLASIMDRQYKAERAWLIPYKVSQKIGGFEFERLLSCSEDYISAIFREGQLHRFNKDFAKYFYLAIQLIHEKYDNNASRIWINNPKSATVGRRFLEFEGVGIKIATMATNILARDFKIPMQDKICIDISPDIHVRRVFNRLGFISDSNNIEELIYCAKELYPEYPGIFDFSAWEIGRNWCRPKNPDCSNCYLNDYCPKNV